ncbi:NEGR1 regulator, partial [Polyodon spathula]|nr:NEGR1 regulator [Polyodon spathula]
MDIMMMVQDACCSGQWLTAAVLSLCCFLPSCLPAAQRVDFPWSAVDNLVARQGDTAVLRCYLSDGASKGAWLNRSSIIFAGDDKWSVDPRVSIVSSIGSKREYSLQIQNVDVPDDGQYTCSVQTQHNPRTMQVHLTVQVPPKIYDISSDIVVNEGTNITLICLASGKPEPSISWRHITPLGMKSFSPLTRQAQSKADTSSCQFCLPNTHRGICPLTLAHHQKMYKPSAAAYKQALVLQVYFGIKNIRMTTTITGQIISQTKITAMITKTFETGEYLVITGITKDQAGDYECSAENDASFPDMKKVKVIVNFPPAILEMKHAGVGVGRTVLIRCETAAVPAPLFEWYKGERKLSNGRQGIIIQNYSTRSILTLSNMTEDHYGNYTCIAVNKLGTANASLPLIPPSTAQYGITGSAEVLFSWWYLMLALSSYISIY